jgi:hypothetical protein
MLADSMSWERGSILASAVGAMRRLLERSLQYANEREQYGQKIAAVPARRPWSTWHPAGDRARFLYKAAWQKSRAQQLSQPPWPALHQRVADRMRAPRDQIQWRLRATWWRRIERELRDSLASTLYSGTLEIQRTIIAPLLGSNPIAITRTTRSSRSHECDPFSPQPWSMQRFARECLSFLEAQRGRRPVGFAGCSMGFSRVDPAYERDRLQRPLAGHAAIPASAELVRPANAPDVTARSASHRTHPAEGRSRQGGVGRSHL